ncbi:MAG: T9SS type A sorting domain-containing protein [Bacteroidia bacterium]
MLCSAQVPYFDKVYGTAGVDVSRSVKQLPSGSIYVLGNSDSSLYGMNDITLTKLDIHGNELWTRYYGTSNTENGFYLNTTADGSFVLVGETETAVNNLDVMYCKVDTNGTVIWNKSYATPVNETARYIEQTSDGGYIIAGSQNDASGYYDMLALKLDANGDYIWSQTYGRTNNDYADMIHQVGTEYILTGDTKSYGAGGYDVMLYQLDSMGIEVWSRTYGDPFQNGCQGLLLTSDGKYLSYGETEIYTASPFEFYLEKIDTGGTSLWRKTFGGPGADALFSVREDSDGGFVCTGYSNSYNGGGPLDLVVLKTDSGGNFLWKQTYGGSGIDIGYELIRDVNDNGFIITGKTVDSTDEYYLLKLDHFGTLSGVSETSLPIAEAEVFPNPSEGLFSLRYKLAPESANADVLVTDVTGRVLLKTELSGAEGSSQLDLRKASAGIYFCSVVDGPVILAVKKLVISSAH